MIHKTLFVSVFVSLALALTACPGSTPAPVVSSVVVTAPASNALKINAATAFTAVAKDSSGVEITGKTFTWVSSDPNVASVDAGGMVTAKRFGDIKITASTDGVNGDSSSQKTFGLEAIGGTRTSFGDTKVRIAYLARFRKADGSGPTGAGVLTLRGPTGWNNNQVDNTNYTGYNNFVWWRSGFGSTEVITGTYSFETTIDGEKFTSTFEIDATQKIASPSNITPSNVSVTSVTGTWQTQPDAASYMFELWNETDAKNAFSQWNYTSATTATVGGVALDPAKTYFVTVHSFNMNFAGGPSAGAFTGTLPKQFNVGYFRLNPKLTF